MSEPTQLFLVRDSQGQVYGPADASTLRQWVEQGRVVPGMSIAPQETREWIDASSHPALATLFAARLIGASPTDLINNPDASSPVKQAGFTSQQPSRPTPLQPTSALNQPLPVSQTTWNAGSEVSYAPPPRANLLGTFSLVAGSGSVLSLCVMCIPLFACVGFPLSGLLAIAAITLGSLAIWQIRANPPAYTGRKMAIVGLSLGIGVLFLEIIVVVVLIAAGFTSAHR